MKFIKKSISLILVLVMLFSTFSVFAVGESNEISLEETLIDTQIPLTNDVSGNSNLADLNSQQNRLITQEGIIVYSRYISSSEDAYIDQSQPNRTTGSDTTLLVGSNKIAYLKYDMSLLPEGAIVTNATISIPYYQINSGVAQPAVFRVEEEWTQDTLSWNNSADIADSYIAITDNPITPSENLSYSNPSWLDFDITSLAKEWAYGMENNGIAIKNVLSNSSTVSLISKNDTNHYGAILSVSYVVLEDGIYSFENFGLPGYYMDIQQNKTTPGYHVQQYTYGTTPPAEIAKSGLFRVERIQNTNRYVIRLMLNGSLSFGFSGAEVLTKTIANDNASVALSDTFTIDFATSGYILRPYGSDGYIASTGLKKSGASGAPDSYLIKQTAEFDVHGIWIPVLLTKNSKTIDDGYVYTLRSTTYTSADMLVKPASTTSGAAAVVAAYATDGVTMLWKFEYVSDGYYKIKNDSTGYYLTAPANNTSGAAITQGAYSSTYGLWKFIEVGTNNYMLQSKNQYERLTGTSLCLAVSSNNLVQSTSTSACVFNIKPLSMNINALYDQAFVSIFGTSNYTNVLRSVFSSNSIGNSIASSYKTNFGIKVNVTYSSTEYESYPYTQDCLYKNTPGAICFDCKSEGTDSLILECYNGLHHKSELKLIKQMASQSLDDSTYINVLLNGHKTCYLYEVKNSTTNELIVDKSKHYPEGYTSGWATRTRNRVCINFQDKDVYEEIMLNDSYDYVIAVVTHELLHLFDVVHCNFICIMGMQTGEKMRNLQMCTTCKSKTNLNKIQLYNHQ